MPLRHFAYRRGYGSFASGLSRKFLCGPLYGGQLGNIKVLTHKVFIANTAARIDHPTKREIGNLLPNNRRQRHTCYALCHILYPVSAAHTSIFRMDSNSTSYLTKTVSEQGRRERSVSGTKHSSASRQVLKRLVLETEAVSEQPFANGKLLPPNHNILMVTSCRPPRLPRWGGGTETSLE